MKDCLFYSSACKHSRDILNELNGHPLVNSLVFYNVDPDPVTKKRNKDLLTILDITATPTLYYSGKRYKGIHAYNMIRHMMNPQRVPHPDQMAQQARQVQQPRQMQPQQQMQQMQMKSNAVVRDENETLNLFDAPAGGGDGMYTFDFNKYAEEGDMVDMTRGANTRDSASIGDAEQLLKQLQQSRQYQR